MPGWTETQTGTVGTYTYNNGDYQLFMGVEDKLKKDGLSFGLFGGLSTDSNKTPAILVDFKESCKYDKNGILSNNLRVRNTFSEPVKKTQVRFSPVTVNVPLGKDVTGYVNPHYVGQYNYTDKTWKNSAGVFVGCQFDKLSLEVQRYNLQEWNNHKGNWGVNILYSVNI